VTADILAHTNWLMFPLVAVVLFLTIYIGVLVWIARPGAREAYAARSRMIFDDERDGGAP